MQAMPAPGLRARRTSPLKSYRPFSPDLAGSSANGASMLHWRESSPDTATHFRLRDPAPRRRPLDASHALLQLTGAAGLSISIFQLRSSEVFLDWRRNGEEKKRQRCV